MFDRLCVIKFFFISFGLDGMKKILALLKDNDMRESKPSNQQGSSIEVLPNSKSLNCAGGVELPGKIGRYCPASWTRGRFVPRPAQFRTPDLEDFLLIERLW